MQENETEVIFQSSDEALQMLAEITGKKIMIPDKAEPTIASQEADDDEDSEIAEDSNVTEVIQKKREQLDSLEKNVNDAISQVKSVVGE